MPRITAVADTVTLTNNNAFTASWSLVNASSVAQALGTKGDGRYVRISIPYDSFVSATATLALTSTLLPPINTLKKQSRFIRAVVGIRAMSTGTSNGGLRYACGSNITFQENVQVSAPISSPGNIYPMLYPINGSNGGTQYWTGTNPADVKVTFPGLRSSSGSGVVVDIDYVRFEYGEADDYIDVDATNAVNRDAALGGTAWVNPLLALTPDTDGASYANSSTNSYALDCTFPNFAIPGKFAGLEIWDSFTPNRFSRFVLDLANWPLSVPISNTPIYEAIWNYTDQALPPISYTPPGGNASNPAAMGYWVWGGGPGDFFAGDEFGAAYNGWTGINEARLTTIGHAVSHIVGMRSSVTTASFLNRVFYRVFYDRVAGNVPLLFCEA